MKSLLFIFTLLCVFRAIADSSLGGTYTFLSGPDNHCFLPQGSKFSVVAGVSAFTITTDLGQSQTYYVGPKRDCSDNSQQTICTENGSYSSGNTQFYYNYIESSVGSLLQFAIKISIDAGGITYSSIGDGTTLICLLQKANASNGAR